MTASIEARKAALLGRTKTDALLGAAYLLEAKGQLKTPEERMTAAWIYDELERRVGLITPAEELEFERIYDDTDSYLAALIALRPQLTQ